MDKKQTKPGATKPKKRIKFKVVKPKPKPKPKMEEKKKKIKFIVKKKEEPKSEPKKKKIKFNVISSLKGEALKTLEGHEKEKGNLKKFVSSINKLKGGKQAIKMANSAEDKPFAMDEGSDYVNGLTQLFSASQRGEKLTQESFDKKIQDVIKIGDRSRGRIKFFQKHKDDLVSFGRSIPSRSEIERKTNSKEEFNYVIGKLRGMHGNRRGLEYKK